MPQIQAEAQGSALLTRFPVMPMLLVQRPRFEDHCFEHEQISVCLLQLHKAVPSFLSVLLSKQGTWKQVRMNILFKILKPCQSGKVICVNLANVHSQCVTLATVRRSAVERRRESTASKGGGEETPRGSMGTQWGGAFHLKFYS